MKPILKPVKINICPCCKRATLQKRLCVKCQKLEERVLEITIMPENNCLFPKIVDN
jgi:hypothetical protein